MSQQRINISEKMMMAFKAMQGLSIYLAKCSIEKNLLDLVLFRVSQINGCAYCLDMHSKDLRVEGESEQRLYLVSAWREAPIYTDRERAAFIWAEAVTRIKDGDVPDEAYNQARQQFSEQELIDLTMAIITINSYNRINIAFRVQAGTYEPGMHAVN